MRRVLRFNVIMSKKTSFESDFTRDQLKILLDLPLEYLKSRAIIERVEWSFDIDCFIDGYLDGCNVFYGVLIDELGFPIYDLQEPTQGYLNTFISWYVHYMKIRKI